MDDENSDYDEVDDDNGWDEPKHASLRNDWFTFPRLVMGSDSFAVSNIRSKLYLEASHNVGVV